MLHHNVNLMRGYNTTVSIIAMSFSHVTDVTLSRHPNVQVIIVLP